MFFQEEKKQRNLAGFKYIGISSNNIKFKTDYVFILKHFTYRSKQLFLIYQVAHQTVKQFFMFGACF